MANTGVLIKRYIWLIEAVSYKPLQLSEIRHLWANASQNDRPGEYLSERTFFNHVDAIREIFSLEIKCNRKGDKCFYIVNRNVMQKDSIKHWMLETITLGNIFSEFKAIHDRILCENVPSGIQNLTPIATSIKECKRIKIGYQALYLENINEYVINPYCLKLFKQRWYVVGKKEDGTIRTFALDRIREFEALDLKFVYPEDFDATDYFNDCYGIVKLQDKPVERVVIKAYSYTRNYIRALPLHHTQVEEETASDYSIFSYRLCPGYDFLHELMSHEEEIEVLSPESLRSDMIDHISKMSDRYNIPSHQQFK